jgi:hypothetical protein
MSLKLRNSLTSYIHFIKLYIFIFNAINSIIGLNKTKYCLFNVVKVEF